MYCSIPSIGNVWLRGRWNPALEPISAACDMKGLGPLVESGVKKGELGLVGPAENDEGAASVKALERDALL